MKKVLNYLKKEAVLTISWVLAIITMFFVPIDKEYLGYIEWDAISLIFMLLLVVEGFKRLGVLNYLGRRLLKVANTRKKLELILILVTFFSAMFLTNDVSLITFVPFSIVTLKIADLKEEIVPTLALQTIAANLGAMLTPIGNPHNIYFFFFSGASIKEFMSYTYPHSILGLVMLILFIVFKKDKEVDIILIEGEGYKKSPKLKMYILLFLVGLFSLTKIVKVPILLLIVLITLLIFDRSIIFKIDYSLLFTFMGFFIFAGNMQRIEYISNLISNIVIGHEMIVSVILCQFISNVATAILLSGFTPMWQVLAVGVDIGGLGTLIASMTNIITYKLINKEESEIKNGYVKKFTIYCIIFLIPQIILFYLMQ